MRLFIFGSIFALVGCGGEPVEWDICYDATAPDDSNGYYAEFGDVQICFTNTSVTRDECDAWGGSHEVVHESKGSVVEDSIVEEAAEEACAANGYTEPCPDEDGYSKAWVQDSADCPALD
jgi:hypothetical protein